MTFLSVNSTISKWKDFFSSNISIDYSDKEFRQKYVCVSNEYPVWTKCIAMRPMYFYSPVFLTKTDRASPEQTLTCVCMRNVENQSTKQKYHICLFCGFCLTFSLPFVYTVLTILLPMYEIVVVVAVFLFLQILD